MQLDCVCNSKTMPVIWKLYTDGLEQYCQFPILISFTYCSMLFKFVSLPVLIHIWCTVSWIPTTEIGVMELKTSVSSSLPASQTWLLCDSLLTTCTSLKTEWPLWGVTYDPIYFPFSNCQSLGSNWIMK